MEAVPLFGFPLWVRRNVEETNKQRGAGDSSAKEPGGGEGERGGSVDGELVVPLILDAA